MESQHRLADALSRSPVLKAPAVEPAAVDVNNVSILTSAPEKIIAVSASDELVCSAKRSLLSTVPWSKTHPLFSFHNRLSISDDGCLVLNGCKVFVPSEARETLLTTLHRCHVGPSSMLLSAGNYFWPGMRKAIGDHVACCTSCCVNAPSKSKAVLRSEPVPSVPWSELSLDFFEFGSKQFLLIVDRASNWFEIKLWVSTTAEVTVTHLEKFFSRNGNPVRIHSDGGPQFVSSVFKNMCQKWGISHRISSPYHPQSNGHAEHHVLKAKKILSFAKYGSSDYYAALINYRNSSLLACHNSAPTTLARGALLHNPALCAPTSSFPSAPPPQPAAPISSDATAPPSAAAAPSGASAPSGSPDSTSRAAVVAHSPAPAGPSVSPSSAPPAHKLSGRAPTMLAIGEPVWIQHPRTKRWEASLVLQKDEVGRSYVLKNLKSCCELWRNEIYVKKRLVKKINPHHSSN